MSERGRQLLWFVALWALSVAAVLAVAAVLRWLFAQMLAVPVGRLF